MLNPNYPGELFIKVYHIIKFNPSLVFRIWRILVICFTLFGGIFLVYLYRSPGHSLLKKKTSLPAVSSSLFISISLLALFVFRIPNLITPEQNPDESQYIATAATVYHGAIFWKDVGGAHGPLISLPLCFMKLLGFGFNYSSLRIFGLCCILCTVFFVWKTLLSLFGERLAMVITLPLTLFFACVGHYDLIAYNSEQVPMALTAICLYLFLTSYAGNYESERKILLLGFFLGLFPWAKLQAIYIGGVVGLIVVFDLWARRDKVRRYMRKTILLVFAPLVPAGLALIYICVNSALYGFWQDTVVWPILYSKIGLARNHFTGIEKLLLPFRMMEDCKDMRNYFATLVFLLIVTCLINYKRIGIKLLPNIRLMTYLTMILTAAYGTVIFPGNDFPHYLILFIVPLTIWAGSFMGWVNGGNFSFGKAFFIPYALVLAFLLVTGIRHEPKGIYFVEAGESYLSKISQSISQYGRVGEPMSIWGWEPRIYVQTGLIQGNYSAALNPIYFVHNSPNVSNPHVKQYIGEMEKSKSVIFLDAVSPKSFYYNDTTTMRHEIFPELEQFISGNYQLVNTIDGNRVYVLKTWLNEMRGNKP